MPLNPLFPTTAESKILVACSAKKMVELVSGLEAMVEPFCLSL